jgi:adenine-specific DNA glycosylase
MDHFTHDEKLFNEYHALLVHLGKTSCKRIPKCDACPLKGVRCEALGVRGKGEDYYWRATYDSRLTTGGRKWLTGKKRFGA